ncbi:MAG: zinc-binding dehydrogenase [Alphaproteobacteria bacterium]|nr:zinc-binding dehydrogenase [Alphaproteobacteria bacterium]
MKAVTLGDAGINISEIDQPSPQPNQILVKVHACGLNRSDLLTTQGQNYGHVGGEAKVMGAEFTGEVVELGSDAEGLNIGDRVMCLGAAGWAEYALASWRRTLPIPSDDVSYEQAATLGGAIQTMHDAIVTNGCFAAGQTILIQGASSGQGLMGMQVAKAKGAKLVIGTSTNSDRRAQLAEFGADMVLDSRDESWVEQVLEATDGNGVDVTIDMLSGYTANQNMAATKVNGYIVNIGRLGGDTGEFDFNLHALRRIHYIGVTGRTRTPAEAGEVTRRTRADGDLWDAVAAGKCAMPIDKVFALKDARAALDRMAANEHFGKIVLSLDA